MIGFINVYKPSGVTSNFVVQAIKKNFHIDKIGHMGTLDPIACGILPIAIGKATRLFTHSQDKIKRYIAIFDFGYTTDSLDTTGIETHYGAYTPSIEEIESVLPSFIGKSLQTPPEFSAKNVNGVRAYNLARTGQKFDLPPKEIEIYDIKLIGKVDENKYKFDIKCGSGTYIRAIGRDIASKLNTYACMSFLERIQVDNFTTESSIPLEKILTSKLDDIILSPINVFNKFDLIEVNDNEFTDLRNGKSITSKIASKTSFVIYKGKIMGVCLGDDKKLKLETYLYEE